MNEPVIVSVIHRHHPGWHPPPDTGREWEKANCPYHYDTNASAGISYRHNAFSCLACDAGGSAETLIMKQEGVSYKTAVRFTQEISSGSDGALPRESPRKRGRRVFTAEGDMDDQPRGIAVPTGIRGRSLAGP